MEEYKLQVSKNELLMKILCLNDDVSEQFRLKYDDKLRDLFRSSSIFRIVRFWRLKLAGHVARKENTRNTYRYSVEKVLGKRPFGRPKIYGRICETKNGHFTVVRKCVENEAWIMTMLQHQNKIFKISFNMFITPGFPIFFSSGFRLKCCTFFSFPPTLVT
jgi:hypothetical protein